MQYSLAITLSSFDYVNMHDIVSNICQCLKTELDDIGDVVNTDGTEEIVEQLKVPRAVKKKSGKGSGYIICAFKCDDHYRL